MESTRESQTEFKSGASFHRGTSKQDYSTPADFRDAVVKRFGMPGWDLAASSTNYFSPAGGFFWDESDNSLVQDWYDTGALPASLLWLNPPFGSIEPWAKKCHEESEKGARILFLVPASVGSYWYSKHVHGVAERVMFLSPRLCFDGKAPFPKDCLLALFEKSNSLKTFYECWRWK